MSRKESYSDRLKREGGMVASGKFKGDRREATCECCRRNDAPQGEKLCAQCARYTEARLAQAQDALRRIGRCVEGEVLVSPQAIAKIARAALTEDTPQRRANPRRDYSDLTEDSTPAVPQARAYLRGYEDGHSDTRRA